MLFFYYYFCVKPLHDIVSNKHFKQFGPRSEIVSEYDQEIPQSQTADNPVAP